MIASLKSFRDTLADLGGRLGVTDPAAGPVVLALKYQLCCWGAFSGFTGAP